MTYRFKVIRKAKLPVGDKILDVDVIQEPNEGEQWTFVVHDGRIFNILAYLLK